MDPTLAAAVLLLASAAAQAAPIEPVKPVETGPLPNRVHVFEDYETDIEKRWWLRGEPSKETPPSLSSIANTRCAKATETKDFDDKQGDASKTYKAVIFNPVPGPPMGKNTRLSFRCKLKGTSTLRVQIYSLSNGYHRNLVMKDLKQDEWLPLAVDMTQARRPDGTGGPLSADERIDDIQFYIETDADLWVDDIVLYDVGGTRSEDAAAKTGTRGEDAAAKKEERPFPKRVIYTGWFDTGKQGKGHEWPGTFEIVPHEKPLTWKCAKSVIEPKWGPLIVVNMRGERPLGDENKLRFRYKLTGTTAMSVTLFNPETGSTLSTQHKELKTGEWAEAEVAFKGKDARTGKPVAVSEIRFHPTGPDLKDAVLLIDDVLLYEPGEAQK